MAVIRSLATLPPLVPTPTIVPTGSEAAGMGVVVENEANDVNMVWVTVAKPEVPERPRAAKDPPWRCPHT